MLVINPLSAKLDVNGFIINEDLNVDFNYSDIAFSEGNIISLREKLRNSLHRILSFLKGEYNIHFSPSDFDAAYLEDEDLNVLFEK